MKTRDPGFDNDFNNGGPGDGIVIWQHALDYIKKLNQENYLGYNDWRLPNRSELDSLINVGQSLPGDWLSLQGFTDVQDTYWSSCTNAGDSDSAWTVQMFGGVVGSLSKNMGFLLPVYVWPVRCGTLNPTNRKQIPGVNSLLLGE